MMIGLGDTPCVVWNTADVMKQFGVVPGACDTLTDPADIAGCQQSQGDTANTVTNLARIFGQACIPPGVLGEFPNAASYIATHSTAPAPPLPAPAPVVQAPPAPTPAPMPLSTPVSVPVSAPIVVGNSGTPITPAPIVQAPASPAPVPAGPVPAAPASTATTTSGLPATIFGIDSTYVLIGGAALLFLMMSGGKR